MSARNHLSMQPNAAIPVAQRLRMTLDLESRISLDEVYSRTSCNEQRDTLESLSSCFLEDVTDRLKDNRSEGDDKHNVIVKARLEVYQKLRSKVDRGILCRHMQSVLEGPEQFYQFRKAFAGQVCFMFGYSLELSHVNDIRSTPSIHPPLIAVGSKFSIAIRFFNRREDSAAVCDNTV